MVSIVSHLEQLSYQQQQQHHAQITQHHHRQKPTSLTLRLSSQQQQLPSPLPSPPQEQPPQAPHPRLTLPPGVQYVRVGPYVIQALQQGDVKDIDHRCVDSRTGRTLACHVYDLKTFHSKAHLLLADLEGVHPVLDVQIAGENAFVISNPTYGDLHQYLRQKRRLSETQAAPLFQQLVRLVCKAHARGIALRDIKLKKIVFEDPERTILSLQHLDDAHQMDSSGQLTDRHGCPAYVSPEMLQPGSYSGRAADLWSLGVILYTLLVGHYPFFDSSPQNLFSKVRSGYYQVPDSVSYLARSLISSLLAYEPEKRVPAEAILDHPWFTQASDQEMMPLHHDQMVPKIVL